MWNPSQYDKFKDERAQPFFDLLDLVQSRNPARVVDLGCGTGALTKILHEKIGAASTRGVDSSADMLAKAPRDVPGLEFEASTIEQVCAEPSTSAQPGYRSSSITGFDLVFSNAALHWVANHESLFSSLTRLLNENGELAVQMPANFDHVSHLVANEVATSERFATVLGGYVRTPPVLAPEKYAEILNRLGFEDVHVRMQVYPHRLASRADLVEWVKGTLLTDYAVRMSESDYAEFLAEYTRILHERVEDTRPFFYPFKRILLRAKR